MLSEADLAIITLCVCVRACVALPGRGGWVEAVCTLLVLMSFGSFSLRELTCMHCVYLAL